MPRSGKMIIVYGANSGIVRRIITADRDGELNHLDHVGMGEESITVAVMDLIAKDGYPDLAACIAAVEAHRGKPSLDANCHIVDVDGNLIHHILADPDIDLAHEHQKGHVLKRGYHHSVLSKPGLPVDRE